jgi:hypothetical protein
MWDKKPQRHRGHKDGFGWFENQVIVELKAVEAVLPIHEAQLLTR